MIKLELNEKPQIKECKILNVNILTYLDKSARIDFINDLKENYKIEIEIDELPKRVFFKVYKMKTNKKESFYLKAFAMLKSKECIDVTSILINDISKPLKSYKTKNLNYAFKFDNEKELKECIENFNYMYKNFNYKKENFDNMFYSLLKFKLLLENFTEIKDINKNDILKPLNLFECVHRDYHKKYKIIKINNDVYIKVQVKDNSILILEGTIFNSHETFHHSIGLTNEDKGLFELKNYKHY